MATKGVVGDEFAFWLLSGADSKGQRWSCLVRSDCNGVVLTPKTGHIYVQNRHTTQQIIVMRGGHTSAN